MEYGEAKELDQATIVTVGEVRASVIAVVMEHFEDATKHETEVLATDVIRMIFNGREREWAVRDLVQDAKGFVWQRWTGSQWKKMGYGGVFPHQTPARSVPGTTERPSDAVGADGQREPSSLVGLRRVRGGHPGADDRPAGHPADLDYQAEEGGP